MCRDNNTLLMAMTSLAPLKTQQIAVHKYTCISIIDRVTKSGMSFEYLQDTVRRFTR